MSTIEDAMREGYELRERWGVWWRDEDGREGWVLSGGLSSPPWSTWWRGTAEARAKMLGQATPIVGTTYEVRAVVTAGRLAS